MTLKQYLVTGMLRHLYPDYVLIDRNRIKIIETCYGKFYYSYAMKEYFDLFEQIEEYNISRISKDDVILDIGACLGAFSIKMSKIAKHIIAVEPLFYDEMTANFRLNNLENVTSLPYALESTRNGVFTGEISFRGRTKRIKYMEFDDIIARCPYKPTVLKMDCEGGEYSIDIEDLKKFRVIEAEVHNFNGHNPYDFLKELLLNGFSATTNRVSGGHLMIHARNRKV